MSRIRHLRPSPAMAVAFVALFVAGAGGATAAKSLITGKQVKNNSITGKDIKDRSLLRKDFKRGQLPAGPQGPQGVAGPAGRAGRDGINGFGELVYSQGESEPIPATETPEDDIFAICPAGTFPTGGDAFYIDDEDPAGLVATVPVASQGIAVDSNGIPVGWAATGSENTTLDPIQLIVDVVCANADDVGFATTTQLSARSRVAPYRYDGD